MKHKHLKGFTLVEMMVVIIVIAILFGISVVTYEKVRQRSANAKTIALVNQWEQSISVYQSKSRLLPQDWTCLGNDVDDFPEIPEKSIGPGQCERNMILPLGGSSWTSEFKTVPTDGLSESTPNLLKNNAASLPGTLEMYEAGTDSYMRGIVYATISEPWRAPDSDPGAFIFYALKGQSCPTANIYRTLEDFSICAARLTDDYTNQIFRP